MKDIKTSEEYMVLNKMGQKTPKDIYELIDRIYHQFNFSKNLMIHNFMIISQDNYYLCQYSDDFVSIQIRVEIHHHLISKPTYELTIIKDYKDNSPQPSDKKSDVRNYRASFPAIRFEHDRPIPDVTIQELIPIFRQFQLDTILENDRNI